MTRTAFNLRRLIGTAIRAGIVATVIVGPLMAVQRVNAGTSQFIGETPVMSNGAGLVIVASLQRS